MRKLVHQVLPYLRRLYRSEQVLTLVVAALIGAASAYGAILFRAMILVSERVFFGSWSVNLEYLDGLPWYWKAAVPAIGALLIAPIVVRFSPESRGSGIPEVIEAVALRGGAVRKRVAPLKAIAAAVCIGSGGSAGREGPIVHIGASIGSWFAQLLRSSVKQMRTFVGCGVAGGIAATFNTPFAGVLFAIEVVLGDFGAARFSPIVIASVVATVISRHYAGNFPHLDVPDFAEAINFVTIWPYFVVGIACAFVSVGFIWCLRLGWGWSKRWRFSPYLLPAVGGLLVGIIGMGLPHVYGVGYDTINHLMENEYGLLLLAAILIGKMLATSATLTSGGSGGIFAPSLFLGAVTGIILGRLTQAAAPGLLQSPYAYALVGMGAVVAGTTRAPLTAILVIFELTNQFGVILPLMAACIPSVLISSLLHRDSIYLAKLTFKGVSLKPRGELNLLKGLRVADVMKRRVEAVPRDLPLTELIESFLGTRFPIMYVTDREGRLRGVIESRNLHIAMLERETLLGLIVAEDVSTPVPVNVHPGDDLGVVMRMFGDSNVDVLPVVDRLTGELMGDLLRGDVIEAYNRELAMRDALSSADAAFTVAERLGQVDIGEGYALMEYEVPAHLNGKTLADVDLRRRAGAQAVLLKRQEARMVPGAMTELQTGDVLVLAGELARMEEGIRNL